VEISGKLRKNDLGKWEIADDEGRVCVLSSGAVVEVQVDGHWIRTRIEYDHGTRDYYALERGVRLCHDLPARVEL
jgi:hypothetical protein